MSISDRLKRFLLGAVLAGGFIVPAAAEPAPDVQQMVMQEAMNSRVPVSLAMAVAKVESNFDAQALSPAGARGVMQLMPKTARDVFGVPESELWKPRLNIQLGIDFLEQLYDQYGHRWDLALSHYNGGTLEGVGAAAIPHDFNRQYVADVLRWQRIYATGVFEPGASPRRAIQVAGSRPAARPPVRNQARNDEHPWRLREERPWRNAQAIDPLEFGDWAEVEQRRLMGRRTLDDFSGG